MAVLSVVIRKKIVGMSYSSVYIRISHNSKTAYIKTKHKANFKSVDGLNVTAYNLLKLIQPTVDAYYGILANVDTSEMTVTEVKELLISHSADVSFSDYFDLFVEEMYKDGRDNQAENYINAFNSLKKFYFKESDIKKLFGRNINFIDLKTKLIEDWIYSLRHTNRAKQHYPTCIRAVFNAGLKHFNDYDTGDMRIKNNPFLKVKIPSATTPQKKSVDIEIINKILNAETFSRREELAKDIAKMIFYLAGINVADLYTLEKSNYQDFYLKYNRHKTKSTREDKSYFEIFVVPEIRPLFEKYKGNEKLFIFGEQYREGDNFTKAVNIGLASICKALKVPAVTSYTFRHSWATIAQNDCKASTEDVAFALNHASAHRVTESYIKKDFSPIDKLNRKVIRQLKTIKENRQ
ncbi:MAG: site-specific integrase [Porphyromonadaceae bacterium]|jgi:integrase|nr:site-specific integrase [Porphyromonadaceae bacterium]